MGCSACGGVKKGSEVKISSTVSPQKKVSALEAIKGLKFETVKNGTPTKNN